MQKVGDVLDAGVRARTVAQELRVGSFFETMRCPDSILEPLLTDSHFLGHETDGAILADLETTTPRVLLERSRRVINGSDGRRSINELDLLVDAMRLERYAIAERQAAQGKRGKAFVRNAYYLLRPFLPVSFRKHLQRVALRNWKEITFPAWPVDTTVERMFDTVWAALLEVNGVQELPFVWFWPRGKKWAGAMTHDVETSAGRDYCASMMRLEKEYGIRSSFEVVPEDRYEVPESFLESIRANECEICVHGLNHDGQLFTSPEVFRARAPRINDYARRWRAKGFRAPVMYRNLDWLGALDFSYDMSVPNVARLDPQRGGCCSVKPYFIGDILELPLTTTQDYSLFHVLEQRSTMLWKEQLHAIMARHGLASFIIHPDYVISPWASRLHQELLSILAGLREDEDLWLACPGQIDEWWRIRQTISCVQVNGQWALGGQAAERAALGWVSLEEGRVVYRADVPD